MIDHINMILRNRPQIKSMSLRLYGTKGSPFPRVRKGLGYKDPKDYQYFVNKHGSLWDIKNDRSYKYDIKKSTPDKIHEPEIVWSKRFPISKVR